MKLIPAAEVSSNVFRVVDVREYPEFAAASIVHAEFAPLGTLQALLNRWSKDDALVFVCKSGRRATIAAMSAERRGFSNVHVLTGGMDAWQSAGLPVVSSACAPWSLERQVRIGAGSIVLASALSGLLLSPWFFALTLFVGAGLVFAGATDLCLMGTVLGKMPWNRVCGDDQGKRQVRA